MLRRIKFPIRNSVKVYLYIPSEWISGGPKICMYEILLCTKIRKFTLWLKSAKIPVNYIEKCFIQNSLKAYFYLPQEWT